MNEHNETRIKLFSNPDNIILGPDESLESINVNITVDGGYNGNGEFEVSDDGNFLITGVDKSNDSDRWIGKGYIVVGKRPFLSY